MSSRKSLFNAIICLALFSGCQQQAKTERPPELSKDAIVIAASMKNVDADKCATVYKQFAGLSDYMKNAGKKVDSTPKLMMLIKAFQTDYDYATEKGSDFDKAGVAFLTQRGYLTPKKIVDSKSDDEKVAAKEIERATVVNDMKELADAAKAALKAKNNAK